jgi:hypothetical protein
MVKFEIVKDRQRKDEEKVFLWLQYEKDGRVLLMSQSSRSTTDYCEVEIKPDMTIRLVKFGNMTHGRYA